MIYNIHVTSVAERDINNAADYIEFVLKNPQSADNLLDAVERVIISLAEYPKKYRLVEDPVLSSWNIRVCKVKNYLVFYTIDEEKELVIVVRFLYEKRDWNTILKCGIPFI